MRTLSLARCPWVHAIFFSADGTRMLVVAGANSYRIHSAITVDVSGGQETGRVALDDPDCYNVDPALNRLVVGQSGGDLGNAVVKWVELPGGADWHEMEIEGAEDVCDVAFDRSGTRLGVALEPARGRSRVDVFEFPPGAAPERVGSVPTPRVLGEIEFSADGTRLAVDGGGACEVFDLRTAKRVFRFAPREDVCEHVRFLPDARLAAAGASKVYVLPARGGKPQFELGGTGQARVNDLLVSGDGLRIVAAMSNGTVRVWDTATGEPRQTYAWGVGGVSTVALAPDGLTGAAAGSKGRIVIWDVDA